MIDALTKLLSILWAIGGVMFFFSTGDSGALGTLWHWAFGLLNVLAAVGFWKYQGWAFLYFSVSLLFGWMASFILIVLAVDSGQSVAFPIFRLLFVMVLIAIFGRWNVERRFRPHLDTDH